MTNDLTYNTGILETDRVYSLTRQSIQLFSVSHLMDLIRGLIMKPIITQKRLKEVLRYEPETGDFFWKIKKAWHINVGDRAGNRRKADDYNLIKVDYRLYKSSRLAWLYMEGYFPENMVDHDNRIRHDDRWCNLTHKTRQCNARNSGMYSHNTSSVKGVYWHKVCQKWAAQVKIDRKGKSLGVYNDFANAVCARLAGEQCLNWSGCDSNSPAYQYVQKMLRGE